MKERGYMVFTTSDGDELHMYFIPESRQDLFDKLKVIYDEPKWNTTFGLEDKLNEIFGEVSDDIANDNSVMLQAPHMVDGHNEVSKLLSEKEILGTLYFRVY